MHEANLGYSFQELVGIEDDLLGLGLGRHGPLKGGSSQPIAIHHSFGLGTGDLPGSPANASIWTPSPVLDKITPVLPQSPSGGAPMPQLLPPRVAQQSHNTPFPAVKTLKELEEEMKSQQQSHNLMSSVRDGIPLDIVLITVSYERVINLLLRFNVVYCASTRFYELRIWSENSVSVRRTR